jgi:hypothetical protein
MTSLLLSGCGGGGGDEGSAPPTVTRGRIGSFDFVFSTTKTRFAPGEGVPITLTVINTGPERIVATGGGAGGMVGNRMNALFEGNGVTVWRKVGTGFGDFADNNWSAGQKREFSYTWPQTNETGNQVEPGMYRITPLVPNRLDFGVQTPETQVVAPPLEIVIE